MVLVDRGTVRNGCVFAVLLAVVVPMVLAAAPSLAGADRSFTVTSGSMAPTLERGDLFLSQSVDPGTVETGDVITYRVDEDSYETHRVVAVVEGAEERRFRTKGDAVEDPDPGTVPADAVVGRVSLVIPFAGYLTMFASTVVGFVVLVVVPLALLVAFEVWSLWYLYREDAGATTDPAGEEVGSGD